MTETSGRDLIEFWKGETARRSVSPSLAANLVTACREVLGTKPTGMELDVRTYPLEELLGAFVQVRPQYTPQTIAGYKSRFRKAVRLFLAYVDDPEAWPPTDERPSRRVQETIWQRYQFPLRGRAQVPLDLPIDLSHEEAHRLAAFIDSLVIGK